MQELPVNHNTNVSLFPNPGKEIVTINSAQKIEQIIFFDAMGRKMLAINEPDRVINMGHLPEGIHFYRVILEDGLQTGGIWIKTDS
ncbi:MAG: T9SS type A sorting domain-containing protein [Bacteroidales bacterium]|nr:T9SS type A sorting domain-containing protein [Bacteroidales bacterium]